MQKALLLNYFEKITNEKTEANIKSFVELCFRKFYKRILVFSNSRNVNSPEDISQDVFLKFQLALMKGLQMEFTCEEDILSYLVKIAINLCISEARKIKSISPLSDYGDTISQVELNLDFDLQERLENSINKLGKKKAKIWRLKIAGFKDAEIAKKLNMELGTVKQNLYRSRQKLKDLIEE